MAVARSHWIALDSLRSDPDTTPAFNRVVQGHENGALRHECMAQQVQQASTGGQRRPFDTVQHPVILLKLFLFGPAHDAQHGGDRARDVRIDVLKGNVQQVVE
jgi:hypothetical protein